MSDLISVTINDGKYTIRQTGPGNWECLRHGEAWPAFDGRGPDNLHVALAYEIHKLRLEVAQMSKPEGSFAWALQQMLWEQAEVIREAEPHIDYSFDGADGCAFWRLDHDEDELDRHAFTCEQILASDWKVKVPEPAAPPVRRSTNLLSAANSLRAKKADGKLPADGVRVSFSGIQGSGKTLLLRTFVEALQHNPMFEVVNEQDEAPFEAPFVQVTRKVGA